MARTVCGIGWIGMGPHNSVSSPIAHRKWCSMLLRVYRPDSPQMSKDYAGTSVDPVWHDFQAFADWFDQQPFCEVSGYELDKDLKVRGNRIYAPEFCSLIPKELNAFISADRRQNLHGAGVGFVKLTGRYFSQIKWRGKNKYLGTFDTKEEANSAYRQARLGILNELVDALFAEGKITKWQAEVAKLNYGVTE